MNALINLTDPLPCSLLFVMLHTIVNFKVCLYVNIHYFFVIKRLEAFDRNLVYKLGSTSNYIEKVVILSPILYILIFSGPCVIIVRFAKKKKYRI